jgi:hypothetical protein
LLLNGNCWNLGISGKYFGSQEALSLFEEACMQRKNIFSIMVAVGILLVVATGFWLAIATPASAQCGSQASSCKNCHEVQGEDSVNNDGTAWHPSHAFGDFCYICHAGNQQATEKDAAHEGMVPPLQDVKASCQQCHPNDLQERAQVYAAALGVEIGSSTSTTPASETPAAGNEAASAPVVVSAPTTTELDVYDPNLVDYEETYDEIVLGKKPINWGNVILLGLIGLLLVGGGGFIIIHEKLVKVSFGDTKKVEGEYPAEVVDLLPAIAGLKSHSRKSLKKVLDNPKKTEKVLGLMDAVVSNEESEE